MNRRQALSTIGHLVASPFVLTRRAHAEMVSLELMCLRDVSGSMDDEEYALQNQGFIQAFRSQAVLDVIENFGAISVRVCDWANVDQFFPQTDWTKLFDAGSIAQFTAELETKTRPFIGSDGVLTAIDAALLSAVPLFQYQQGEVRQVIDVAGDGSCSSLTCARDNFSNDSLIHARDKVMERGITINGLPFIEHDTALLEFYRKYVIGGPGAFALPVTDINSFPEVFERKLTLEIAGCEQGSSFG